MTDEEKACKSICGSTPCKTICTKCKCYLAGLEAGRPKWHDLRKDPNDVPTEKGDYWVIDADGDYSVIYAPIAVKHCNDADMYKALNIVAWCELPKFEG